MKTLGIESMENISGQGGGKTACVVLVTAATLITAPFATTLLFIGLMGLPTSRVCDNID